MKLPLILLLPALAAAAPLALHPRQDNAGSTSTSTSNNSGSLFGGLTSSGAAAAEDGSSTSSTGTSSCSMFPPFSLPTSALGWVG